MDFTFKDVFYNKVHLVTSEEELIMYLEDGFITESTVVFDNINIAYVPLAKLKASAKVLERFKPYDDRVTDTLDEPTTSSPKKNHSLSFIFSSILTLFGLISLIANYIYSRSIIGYTAVEGSLEAFNVTTPIYITFIVSSILLFSILKSKTLSKKATRFFLFSVIFLVVNVSYLGFSIFKFNTLDNQVIQCQNELKNIVEFGVKNDTKKLKEFSEKKFSKQQYGDFYIILEKIHQNTIYKVNYTTKFNSFLAKIKNIDLNKFINEKPYHKKIMDTFSETKTLQKHLLVNYKTFHDDVDKYTKQIKKTKYNLALKESLNNSHNNVNQIFEQFVNNERLLIDSLTEKYEYIYNHNKYTFTVENGTMIFNTQYELNNFNKIEKKISTLVNRESQLLKSINALQNQSLKTLDLPILNIHS